MNRRQLFKNLAGLATAGAVGVSVSPVKKYGRLTIDGHRHHLKSTGENLCVYVDGAEVKNCYEADDVEGFALAFCSDEQDHRDFTKAGRLHIGGGGRACRVRLTGHVVISPGPART